jgi:hypothetical protein
MTHLTIDIRNFSVQMSVNTKKPRAALCAFDIVRDMLCLTAVLY